MANSVIKGNDSGWKTASGDDGNLVYYRKIGNIVYVRRETTGTVPLNTPTVIGILPVGYRPNNVCTFVIRADSEGFTWFTIEANTGKIVITTTVTANYIPAFYISFLAN